MAGVAQKDLTRKQADVLEYIKSCVERDGRTPTIRQVGKHFGLRSTGSVRDVYAALEKKGWLARVEGLAGGGARLDPDVFTIKVTQRIKYRIKTNRR